MKAKELLRLITQDGWFPVRQKGSHNHFKHATKTGLVTIAYSKLSDDIPKGTEKSIRKQAGI